MVFIYILTIIVLLYIVFGFKNFFKSLFWRLQEKKEFNRRKITDSNLYFYLLVPALREQNVILRTLNHLSRLNYLKGKYEIIVALDKKETPSNGSKITTREVLEDYIKDKGPLLPKISFCEYNGLGQKRAYQLNTALNLVSKKINKDGRKEDSVFIGVYDADSLPNINVLNYIEYKYYQDKNNVSFQQNINYLLNSFKLKNIILLGNAYYQTMWNYMFETNRFLCTNEDIEKKKSILFPPYCMGHGEYIRLDVLKGIGGFPSVGAADGIQMGFILSAHKYRILPVPFDDYCESPETLTALYKQHTFWSYGNYQFFKIAQVSRFFSIEFLQNLNHVLLFLKWACKPFVVSLLLILWLFINPLVFWCLLVLIWIYYLTIYFFTKHYILTDCPYSIKKMNLKSIFLPFAVFFKSFGALNAAFKLLSFYIFNKEIIIKSKIER